MKVAVITDMQGKILGAHRTGAVRSGSTTLMFVGVTNSKQKSHDVDVPDEFFSRPLPDVRGDLQKLIPRV
jgi:hypothetical protein